MKVGNKERLIGACFLALVFFIFFFGFYNLPDDSITLDSVDCIGRIDVDDCQNSVFKKQSFAVCSKMVNWVNDDVRDFSYNVDLQDDVNILEKEGSLALIPVKQGVYWNHATRYENDSKILDAVECRTDFQACPRKFDIETEKGGFCWDITVRTLVTGDNLQKLLNETFLEEKND